MLFPIIILVDIWARKKVEYLVWASSCVTFHLNAVLAAWQSCFPCFLKAKELLLISLLGKVKLGLPFGHSHLLLAFPDPTVFCVNLSFFCFLFLLSSLVLSSSQLRHVSSNEINEGLCNFEWASFNCDLYHSCCFRVYPWVLGPKSFGRRQLEAR